MNDAGLPLSNLAGQAAANGCNQVLGDTEHNPADDRDEQVFEHRATALTDVEMASARLK